MGTIELKPGVQFNRMGRWYVEIDKVLKQNDKAALVECHEDDGFKQYYIFLNEDGGWKTHMSSTDPEAAEYSYNMWSK